jgi:hypothetical protein
MEDLEAGADIDGVRLIVMFRSHNDGFCGVFHIEELPCGRPGTPDLDGFVPPVPGVHALFDQGWNDMGGGGIEVVPRP